MTIPQILKWAQHHNRIGDGLVLCENCDNPALKSGAVVMSWVGCGACYFGETAAIDPEDVIEVADPRFQHKLVAELKAERCRCGKKKQTMRSFCFGCYKMLTKENQLALYKRIGEGYEQAYRKALNKLIRIGRPVTT